MRTSPLFLALVTSAFTSFSCARQPDTSPRRKVEEPAQPKPFKGLTYRGIEGHIITMTSPDELELTEGGVNLVCKYTQQDNAIRVVVNTLGTTQAVYYRIRPDGLEDPKGRMYYSKAGAVDKTRSDMCTIATAYHSHYIDFSSYYLVDAMHSSQNNPRALDDRTDGPRTAQLVSQALSPLYIHTLPVSDLYGNQYGFAIRDQGKRISITSFGPDHAIGGGDDVVLEMDASGATVFVMIPEGATPKSCP